MHPRFRIGFAALLLVLIAAVACLMLRPAEPVYEGRRLSGWLSEINYGKPRGPQQIKADGAVRYIGTNGIPTLLRMLRARDSAFKTKVISLVQKQRIIKIRWVRPLDRNAQAAHAFHILGPAAEGAVPALIQIFEQNISESSRIYTARSLTAIGPAASSAAPALVQGLNQRRVRIHILGALGSIKGDPAVVVPAVTECLHDADTDIRSGAVGVLIRYGEAAKPAVPTLLQLLKSEDEFDRLIAPGALKEIDPEAASQAGVE